MAKRTTELLVISVEEDKLVVADGIRRFEFKRNNLSEFKKAMHAAIYATKDGASRSFRIYNSNVYGLFFSMDAETRIGFSLMFGNPSAELQGSILKRDLMDLLRALL